MGSEYNCASKWETKISYISKLNLSIVSYRGKNLKSHDRHGLRMKGWNTILKANGKQKAGTDIFNQPNL